MNLSPLDISKAFYAGNSNMTQYRTHTFTYDGAGRLLSVQHLQGTNAIGAISYGYNSGGNRTNRVENGVADAYSYDAVDQITGVNYSTNRTVSYAYDALGNRSSVTDNNVATAYTANNLNQYTVVGGSALGYDAKGNLISGPGSASYTYDGNNRLTSATVGTNSATFAHDAQMRNVKRVINGQTRFFYFDGWSLVQERDGSGNVVQNYVNGPRIDEIIRKTDSGGAVYYHSDALGSTVALTDGAGAVVESYSYDIFGAPTVRDGNGNVIPASAYANRFLFTGREWIKEVGVYDYRNRIYSAALARFLQTDPITFESEDENLYRYVANNPISRHDPLGLCPKCCSDAARAVKDAPASLLRQYAQCGGELGKAAQCRLDFLNKLNHIFGKAQHRLDGLVKQFGSEEKAFEAIQKATEAAMKGTKGVFETSVRVGTEQVTVRGNVIDGTINIGTAFTP